MADPVFFRNRQRLSIGQVLSLSGGTAQGPIEPDAQVDDIRPLDAAGPRDLAYMDNARYAEDLEATAAGWVLVSRRFLAKVPQHAVAILCRDPYGAYAACLAAMYPEAMRPGSMFGAEGISPGAIIHPTARLEPGVIVDPGAVIGPRVEIGRGTVVAAGAVIGPDCRIGRDCSIASHVTLQCALLGNGVILHPGVRVGQDGFGYAMGREGHAKVPQTGRVIIQDRVEVGANSTIDRGATRDTIIGEGTKIDNLVQIAHNVVVGRNCIIVAYGGVSGSATLEDGVVLGARVGVVGHLRIGAGAQIAASSNVATDVPPGVRWGGSPAKPMRDWIREMLTLSQLARRRHKEAPDGRDALDGKDDA